MEQLIPDYTILETGRFIRQNILRNIFKEFIEDIVQSHEVDQFRSVFLINS